jgi:hypothetical protein
MILRCNKIWILAKYNQETEEVTVTAAQTELVSSYFRDIHPKF